MKPVISIIVPIYRVEKYLKRCIDSILSQTFKDFELILVDDGSPDRCGEICDEYTKKDNRIKVIHKKNGGLSDARNAGLEVAKGKYIGFIDSDDFINENMYKILYEAMVNTKSDIVQCKFKYFSYESEIEQVLGRNIKYKIFNNIDSINGLMDNDELNVNVWNKLYCKTLFKDIRFPKGKIYEDEYVTYKVFYNANKICYVDKELYYYFNNLQGIMKNSYLIKRFDWIDGVEERNKFLLEHNKFDLYDKSNKFLFFYILKLQYLISKDNKIEAKKDYNKKLNEKINYLLPQMKSNNQMSLKNRIIIKLACINKHFLKIYNFNNWIMSVKYKFK